MTRIKLKENECVGKISVGRLGAGFFTGVALLLCAHSAVFAQESSINRIISLSPPVTEELYLLGAQERLVGVTTYCLNPPEASYKEKIGEVTNVNVEKIVSLRPDLVLASSLTDVKAVEKLKALGIRTEVFPQPRTFGGLCEDFLRLGRMVGAFEKAREIVDKSLKDVSEVKEMIKGQDTPKVFVQIGANPLFAATRESFINDFIELAGGINIARDEGIGFYSREKVIEADPDVIIIVLMGISGKKEKAVWENFKTLKAVTNNRVYILDAYGICSPTPANFVRGLKDFVNALHPGVNLE